MKKKQPITKHHRKPRCKGGGDNKENISLVPDNKHCAFHLLFDEGSPEKVADRCNKYWIDPAYELVAVPKEYAEGIRKRILSYVNHKQ